MTRLPKNAAARRRRHRAIAGAVTVTLSAWLCISVGGALADPALGGSPGARLAEWARAHGANGPVNWAEDEWYSHHAPAVGGRPPAGAIRRPRATPVKTGDIPHLPPPAPVEPIASPAIPGEGQWSPAGRLVGGVPAVFETTLRPDAVHTSYVAGIAWMDTKLLRATLYSGSRIPGGRRFTHTAPISAAAATGLVAAFNAGFLMPEANGGYFTDRRTILPLRNGAASFVVYADGVATVGAWGSDVAMSPSVVSVRQNLDLLVDHGQPVPGLEANDTSRWGYTLGNAVYVWRSGLGVTAGGALVYVAGPGLDITDLANLLARAGAVRAMELDINTDWVNFATYDPGSPGGAADPANGTDLLADMAASPARYFEPWWARDFITMSSALGARAPGQTEWPLRPLRSR